LNKTDRTDVINGEEDKWNNEIADNPPQTNYNKVPEDVCCILYKHG
jgi:hypothetical protein